MPETSPPMPSAPAGLPRSEGPAGQALMAAGLALVMTIYMTAGVFERSTIDPLHLLFEFTTSMARQFVVSWGMLWAVARSLRAPASTEGPSRRRIGLATFCCTVVGVLLQGAVTVATSGFSELKLPGMHFAVLWYVCLSTLLVLAQAFTQRSQAAAAAWHQTQVRQLALERELSSARLQLLQAQVEPHFIFNALANVRRLLRTDAAASRSLVTDLLRYLEEALPRLRDEQTTLGREVELVRAYLAVHQVRMGPRLRTEIDVPAALADRPVPPMALLTLVENALKHGLQPMVEGGTVRVAARAESSRLTLTVADDGHGMGSGSGHGTGLANLRARLRAMYGASASLALAVNEPRGVIATITIPDQVP
jgi:hypothetical protein